MATKIDNIFLDQNAMAVVVGYGKMGRMYGRQMLKGVSDNHQIIIIDPSLDRQQQAIQDGIDPAFVFSSLQEAMDARTLGQKPILMINATSESVHYNVAKTTLDYVAQQGNALAYVTEKPFMTSTAQAEEIAAGLERVGAAFALNMICEHAEFRPKVTEMISDLRQTHNVSKVVAALGTNHLTDSRNIYGVATEIVHPLGIIDGLFPEAGGLTPDCINVWQGDVSDSRKTFRCNAEGVWSGLKDPNFKAHVYSGFNWTEYQCPVVLEFSNKENPSQRKYLQLYYDEPGTYQDGWVLMHEDGSKESYLHIDTQDDIPPNMRGFKKLSRMVSRVVDGFNEFLESGDPRTVLGPNNLQSALMLQRNIDPLQGKANSKVRVFDYGQNIPLIAPPLPDLRELPDIMPEAYAALLDGIIDQTRERYTALGPQASVTHGVQLIKNEPLI